MNTWPVRDIHPVSEMAVTEGKEVYNIVLLESLKMMSVKKTMRQYILRKTETALCMYLSF